MIYELIVDFDIDQEELDELIMNLPAFEEI